MTIAPTICRAAVEPERPRLYPADSQQTGVSPGILAEALADFLLIGRRDGVEGPLTVANRAAEDEEPVVDQPVHECRVRVPAVLLTDWPRSIPVRAVDQGHCEVGHGRSVLAATDSRRLSPELYGDVEGGMSWATS